VPLNATGLDADADGLLTAAELALDVKVILTQPCICH
jgi:hypothetical protein